MNYELCSTPLGSDLGAACTKAEKLLVHWDTWLSGKPTTDREGSIRWLFKEYKKTDAWINLSDQSQKDYAYHINRLNNFQLKANKFGDLDARSIKTWNADKLYKLLQNQHGMRQASYAMQICRRVWGVMKRAGKISSNPFTEMGISLKPKSATREWSRAEYELFKKTTIEMGHQVVATAAALAFEFVQRLDDVIGRINKGGRIVDAMLWSDYQPRISFAILQNKTRKRLNIPLRDHVGPLFQELEKMLSVTPKLGPYIIMDTKTNAGIPQPMTNYKFARIFKAVRAQAGLSDELKFRAMRHGGATELGDAGVEDIRSLTGHSQMNITGLYNKANSRKAAVASRKRLLLIEELADAAGNKKKKK